MKIFTLIIATVFFLLFLIIYFLLSANHEQKIEICLFFITLLLFNKWILQISNKE